MSMSSRSFRLSHLSEQYNIERAGVRICFSQVVLFPSVLVQVMFDCLSHTSTAEGRPCLRPRLHSSVTCPWSTWDCVTSLDSFGVANAMILFAFPMAEALPLRDVLQLPGDRYEGEREVERERERERRDAEKYSCS